ncbi:MAG: hypothetical protein KAR23_00595 [Candidatus Aenigmarchaeota archaeon]|nr:hypothetical protein [Candidatus Aenigmarchaeota archaeon]
MRKEVLLVLLIELVLFSSFVYGFEISSPGSSQVGYTSPSSFFDINNILSWTYELIADFFGIPMEDMRIRGGYLFAFVLAPMLLAYMMFYGIMDKLRLFDNDKINMWIPLLLSLMLAPLGAYRRFFFAATSFMTIGTATLLYIFLFVALLGYGYRYMFASGVRNIKEGNFHISDMESAKKDIKDLDKNIIDLTKEIHDAEDKIHGLVTAGVDENSVKITTLQTKITRLTDQRKHLLDYKTKRRSDINASVSGVIQS